MEKIKKIWKEKFPLILGLSLIGFYLTLNILGPHFIKIFSTFLVLIAGLIWTANVGNPPQQDSTRYVYRKDRSKLFDRGELLSQTPMSGKKSLSQAQKEYAREIEKKGGYGFLFKNFFLKPMMVLFVVFYLFTGWISLIVRIFSK